MQDERLINSVELIQDKLLDWFIDHGRHWIPWKLKQDGLKPSPNELLSPYGIWIAEVMLQQTQLKVAIPFWDKWMKTFPTLESLSDSGLEDILFLWQGLGYYSRARYIYQASKILINVVGENSFLDYSRWPFELHQWIALPGIGRSTAGSIISSAFNLPEPILDGNVKRIISRLIASPSSKDQKRLWDVSTSLLSSNHPRDFNQALMDLGAQVCIPKNPICLRCPLNNFCLAYIKYDPIDFPKKNMKKPMSMEQIGIGIILNKDGEILIDQRKENSRMGGMWEFPGGKQVENEVIEQTIEREIKEELGIIVKVGKRLISFEHSYSHKKLNFIVHLCEWKSGQPRPLASQKLLWVLPDKLLDYSFPAANTKIIAALYKYLGILNKKI